MKTKSIYTCLRQLFAENVRKIGTVSEKEGNNEFMNIIVNEINNKLNIFCNKGVCESVTCFLTVGDEKSSGLFVLSGKDSVIQELGPKVADILEGKISSSRGPYQSKANKLSNKAKAEKLVRDYVKGANNES